MERTSAEVGPMNTAPYEGLITIQAVLDLHHECIHRYGGNTASEPSKGCIEASLGNAWQAECYTASDDAVKGLTFAGCLLFYLIANHCFVDGNKRVGWAACMEVLRSLGLTVQVSDEDAEAFCLAIAAGDAPITKAVEVSGWLAPRLTLLPS